MRRATWVSRAAGVARVVGDPTGAAMHQGVGRRTTHDPRATPTTERQFLVPLHGRR